ncbi:hypothetical protein GF407_11095 [candidate division KSB1 bacterium]|nr:hypothetical protein [candidate division KSB1 bacterium]
MRFMNSIEKTNRRMILLILYGLIVIATAQPQISKQKNKICLQNKRLTKEIYFSETTSAPIRLSLRLNAMQQNILDTKNDQPLFTFCLNNTLLQGSDPAWKYKDHHIRHLQNQGLELELIFTTEEPAVKGLELVLCQQIFSNTTFIREKLELRAVGTTRLYLNKCNGILCFKFPMLNLPVQPPVKSTEIRIASWAAELIDIDEHAAPGDRFGDNPADDHDLGRNHMFHPRLTNNVLKTGETQISKGPIQIISTNTYSWITTYEHASQDNTNGLLKSNKSSDSGLLRDNLQGVKGNFDFLLEDGDFHFLGITQRLQQNALALSVDILRGGYLDGEVIDANHSYSSVWTGSGIHAGNDIDSSKAMIHDYLYSCICEKPASRRPHFYYNTWGMQRSRHRRGEPLRGILTYENIFAEIRRAADLNVDIFVLDDGWETAQGIWEPHPQRLPQGLAPIKAELDKHGMMLGVWFSPMGIDSSTERYQRYREWVIKDSEGRPVPAQWEHPAFDFVSDFFDLFVTDCKRLIDQGVRFFKWDAINTFFSTLPNLHHGSDRYSKAEIRARYEYLLPLYVTRAMKHLTDYEPNLIIEIDLTEARRVMTGLAVLSQGKYFWMNNGASWYDDYSTYRTKSMRTIANRFAGLIPLELFTYACYPHNDYNASRYNVNTIFISGHGLWGDLQQVDKKDRQEIGKQINKAKRVLPYIAHLRPNVIGRVGASPEIYTMVNREKTAGQIIAFSGSAAAYIHRIELDRSRMLAVLNHAYRCNSDTLQLDFEFPMPDATREAFILPNLETGITISASTSWLDEAELIGKKHLRYTSAAPGEQTILWPGRLGQPQISASEKITWFVRHSAVPEKYSITIKAKIAGTTVRIDSQK